jgi:hypothetical protein
LILNSGVKNQRPDPVNLYEQAPHGAARDPNGPAYNRVACLPERRKMMRECAEYLEKLKADAEIVPMNQSA